MSYADNYQRNIKSFMLDNGISGNSLANQSGISQKTIWVTQAGKTTPTVNTAQAIADALGLDARVLLNSELTSDQMDRSKRIGRLLDDLIELKPEQLSHIVAIVKAFKEPSA
jgi:transcriptional regulator with XRE-family HTH domain